MIRLAPSYKYNDMHFLEDAGIDFVHNAIDDKLCVRNFPLELVDCCSNDLSQFFAAGLVDLAIVDSFRVDDSMQIVRRLGYNRQKLQLLAASSVKNKSLAALNGKNISTAYPELLGNYLKANGVRAKIVEIQDKGESFGRLNVFDIFEYTCTFVDADLTFPNSQVLDTICESEAVLVKSTKLSPQNQLILDELLLRIDAVLNVKNKCEATFCVPTENCTEAKQLLGENVTCIVADDKTSFVRAIVEEVKFWDVIEKLKALGATNIILNEIEKLIS